MIPMLKRLSKPDLAAHGQPAPQSDPGNQEGLACLQCGSLDLRRSHRRGWLERLRCWLTREKVYRCHACGHRFWC